MRPVPMPNEDQLPPGPRRDLVAALYGLYENARTPGLRRISEAVKNHHDAKTTLSFETVRQLIRGGTPVERWANVQSVTVALVKLCDEQRDTAAELERMGSLWRAAFEKNTPELRERQAWLRGHRKPVTGALALVPVVVVVVVLIVLRLGEQPTRSNDDPRFTPVSAGVPHCATFRGHGRIPEGSQLVLFDQDAFPSGQAKPGAPFSYEGIANPRPDGSGWTADHLSVGSGDGDTGDHKLIVAVLMPDRTAARVQEGSGSVPHLPTTAKVVDRMAVVRNGIDTQC